MKLPIIQGVIRRRMLVNFRVDPEVAGRELPAPFRPKLHDGAAIAGVCLIRLEALRPRRLPAGVGVASENAAHRIAVVWEDADGVEREGVYIPRRDSDSAFNQLLGGRLFPGRFHPARFEVHDDEGAIDFTMRSDDGETEVRLVAREAERLPEGSGFGSLAEASAFFEDGAVGYSATGADRLDGILLATDEWRVAPLAVEEVASSYFADTRRFPPGSVAFDCALVMRDLRHEWHALPALDSEP